MNICSSFGCGRQMYKTVKLSNGAKQNKCQECYTRRIAATRAVKEKKK